MLVSLIVAQEFSKYNPGTLGVPWDPLRVHKVKNIFGKALRYYLLSVFSFSPELFEAIKHDIQIDWMQKQIWGISCFKLTQTFAKTQNNGTLLTIFFILNNIVKKKYVTFVNMQWVCYFCHYAMCLLFLTELINTYFKFFIRFHY